MHRPQRAAFPLALASLFASLLASAPSASQSAAAPPARADEPQSVFGETVEVRVVNLEVVVVDSSGHRVAGLGPGDLKLTVDGKPVSIDYFTEVVEGRAAAESGGAEAPPAPQGTQPGGEV